MSRWGFKTNQYDWCVTNNDIEGDQCKILWNVDNINIPHKNPRVVTIIIDLISFIYGREFPLAVICGKVCEYIGTTIDFYHKGKVNLTMYDYNDGMLEDIPEHIKIGESATTYGDHLFIINKDNPENMNQLDAIEFYHVI